MKTLFLLFITFACTGSILKAQNVSTLLSNLEYPSGLYVSGNYIYLTETAGFNTGYGGKNCLDKYDMIANQKTLLLDHPICSNAVVVASDGKVYLTSYVNYIPGESGKVTVYDPVLNIESLLVNIEIASEDMILDNNGDILIIGSSGVPGAKSLYKLPFGSYTSPIVLMTDLGITLSLAKKNETIYFSTFQTIEYFSSDGIVQPLSNSHGAISLSISNKYLYYSDFLNQKIGRINLTTYADETILTVSNAPSSLRYSISEDKLYFMEFGTDAGKYKDGTLKVISNVELTTGINTANQSIISLYPNPASSILNFSNLSKKAKVIIYDIYGNLILGTSISNNQINISKLLNGVYTFQIYDNNEIITKKFIKQ